jgi:glutaredoxin
MVEMIREKNEKYPVMVYSKSYCPYCGQVKALFKKLQVDFQAVDLDEIHEGQEVQDNLMQITGSRTVPQVFISGQYIGGCDETLKLNSSGKLKQMLNEAGINSS